MYRQSSGRVGAGARQSAAAPSKPQAAISQQQQGGAVKRTTLTDFEKLVTIAKGSFGVVYKATRKDNGRVYALKQVEIAEMNRAEREEAVDEVRARRHFLTPPTALSDPMPPKKKNKKRYSNTVRVCVHRAVLVQRKSTQREDLTLSHLLLSSPFIKKTRLAC